MHIIIIWQLRYWKSYVLEAKTQAAYTAVKIKMLSTFYSVRANEYMAWSWHSLSVWEPQAHSVLALAVFGWNSPH